MKFNGKGMYDDFITNYETNFLFRSRFYITMLDRDEARKLHNFCDRDYFDNCDDFLNVSRLYWMDTIVNHYHKRIELWLFSLMYY